MRKVALLFVLAVMLPSLVLAWLAVRSLRDQQFVLERQQSLLYQGITDSFANQAQALLAQRQREFGQRIEEMLAQHSVAEIAVSFDERLKTNWPPARVGFVVTTQGAILSPSLDSRPEANTFRFENAPFLGNRESAEVYVNSGLAFNKVKAEPLSEPNRARRVQYDSSVAAAAPKPADELTPASASPIQTKQASTRNISPQQRAQAFSGEAESLKDKSAGPELSKIAPAEAEFSELIGDADEGTLARFVNNRLNLLLWYRSPQDARYIFGAQLDLNKLSDDLRQPVQMLDYSLSSEICVAILNDAAKPVALSRSGFEANWRRPFVATEIGEALPHWEVAAYLLNPAQLTESARLLKLTLGLLIALLVIAIAIGGWLIVRDLNQQLRLARQKTDFVSNVSHELKTPLTSIRMFSELLAEGRVTDAVKQRSYLNIITAETARLTRLINNVLDFSRMDRGEKKYHFRACDLVQLARENVDSYRPHLENNGFELQTDWPSAPVMVQGDCDALAQVIVNLLSNAEKYSNQKKEISVTVSRQAAPLPFAELKISDRGSGVPRGSEEKIFEKFYRAHDSLSSGIQGSGLGLTLARQIARAHGGDIMHEPREGGGSCFCLRLPLKAQPEETPA